MSEENTKPQYTIDESCDTTVTILLKDAVALLQGVSGGAEGFIKLQTYCASAGEDNPINRVIDATNAIPTESVKMVKLGDPEQPDTNPTH